MCVCSINRRSFPNSVLEEVCFVGQIIGRIVTIIRNVAEVGKGTVFILWHNEVVVFGFWENVSKGLYVKSM